MFGKISRTQNYLIAFLAIIFYACNDTPSFTDPVPVYGPHTKLYPALGFDNTITFTANKNGIPFTGNLEMINHNVLCQGCYSLILMTFEDSAILRDWVAITNLNILNKDFELFPNLDHQTTIVDIGYEKEASSYYDTRIEDQHLDSYQLYNMADNWLSIESIDTVSGIIKGSFQAHYEKTWEQDPNNPKYIKFSEGVFEFNYKE